jgi:hypothetical protein
MTTECDFCGADRAVQTDAATVCHACGYELPPATYVPDGPSGEVSLGDFVIATVEGQHRGVGTVIEIHPGVNSFVVVRMTESGQTLRRWFNPKWLRRAAEVV